MEQESPPAPSIKNDESLFDGLKKGDLNLNKVICGPVNCIDVGEVPFLGSPGQSKPKSISDLKIYLENQAGEKKDDVLSGRFEPLRRKASRLALTKAEDVGSWSHLQRYRHVFDFGHYLGALSLSRNGKLAATCGDEQFTVMDMYSHKPVFNDEFELSVKVCAFSNDCTMLAYGRDALVVRNTSNWEPIVDIPMQNRIYNILWSENDQSLYVSAMEFIKVFDLATKEFKISLTAPGTVKAFAVLGPSPADGRRYLAFGGRDYGLVLADLDRALGPKALERQAALDQPLAVFLEDDYPRIAAFSPDGQHLAWGGHDKVLTVEMAHLADVRALPFNPDKPKTRGLAFAPDSLTVAYAGADTLVRVVHVATGQCVHVFPGFREGVWAVAYSPDGKWVAAASYNRKLEVLRLGNRDNPHDSVHSNLGKVQRALFSKSADHMLVATADNRLLHGTVRHAAGEVYDDVSDVFGEGASGGGGGFAEAALALSPSGRFAAAAPAAGGPGAVYDLDEQRRVCLFEHGDQGSRFLTFAEGDGLLMGESGGTLVVTQLPSGREACRRTFGIELTTATFSSCARYVAVAEGLGSSVWALRRPGTGKEGGGGGVFRKGKGRQQPRRSVAEMVGLVPGAGEGWALEGPLFVGEHSDTVTDVAFPEGTTVQYATASLDYTVKVWDVVLGQCLATYQAGDQGAGAPVAAVAWSRETPGVLMSRGQNGDVALWDAREADPAKALVYLRRGGPELKTAALASLDVNLSPDQKERCSGLYCIYEENTVTVNVDLVLRAGPCVDTFLGAALLSAAYLSSCLRRFPYLGTCVDSASGEAVVEKVLAADRADLLGALLEGCPLAALAHVGPAAARALRNGNQALLLRVLRALMQDGVSHKCREALMGQIDELLEKAPQVLAEVLNHTELEGYEVPGLQYAYLGGVCLRPGTDWGAAGLWAPERAVYDVKKALATRSPEAAAQALASHLRPAAAEDPGGVAALGAALLAVEKEKTPLNKVVCYRVPLPGLASLDVLERLYDADVIELFESPTVCCVVTCLWEQYFRKRFYILFGFNFAMFLINTASAIISAYTVHMDEEEDARWTTVAWVLSITLMVIAGYQWTVEIRQLRHTIANDGFSIEIFLDPWSWLDWTYYTCVIVAGCLNLTDSHGFRQVGAVNVIFSSFEMLKYMRGFESVGFLISALIQSVSDLGPFLLITFTIITAFSCAFFTLWDLDEDAFATTWRMSLFSTFCNMLGMFFYFPGDTTINAELFLVLLTIYIFVSRIVLLNLIVSILGDTYSVVTARSKPESMRERCGIILEISSYLSSSRKKKLADDFRWVHVMAPFDSSSSDPAGGLVGDPSWSSALGTVVKATDRTHKAALGFQEGLDTAGKLAKDLGAVLQLKQKAAFGRQTLAALLEDEAKFLMHTNRGERPDTTPVVHVNADRDDEP